MLTHTGPRQESVVCIGVEAALYVFARISAEGSFVPDDLDALDPLPVLLEPRCTAARYPPITAASLSPAAAFACSRALSIPSVTKVYTPHRVSSQVRHR